MCVRHRRRKVKERTSGFVAPLLLMCFALGALVVSLVPPFAQQAQAAEDAKIVINNATEGQTYHLYRLMDLKVAGDATKPSGYAYTANETWKEFLSQGKGSAYVSISKAGNVTFKGDNEATKAENTKKLAAEAISYAKSNKVKPIASQTYKASSGNTLSFSGLPFGYYLVDSSTGSLCSLNTTSSTVTISDKTTAPSLKKMVSDSSNPTEDEVTDANGCNNAALGDIVTFKIEVKVGNGPVNYVVHDTMDKGLTFDPSSVTVKKESETLAVDKDYTLNSAPNDGCTFELLFAKDSYGTNEKLVSGATYVVEYKATINKQAVVSTVGSTDAGNANTAYVSYGDESNLKSNTGETHTYVLSLPIYKFSNIPSDNTPLKGAKFALQNAKGLYWQNKEGLTAWVSDVSNASILETDDKGITMFPGIDEGSYSLIETESPIGYNKLDEPVAITVKNAPSTKAGDAQRYESRALINGSAEKVEIENQTGGIFPGTGGPGAFLIAAGGVAFVFLGVIVSFVVWRRSAQADAFSVEQMLMH